MISTGASTDSMKKGQGRGEEYNQAIFYSANMDLEAQSRAAETENSEFLCTFLGLSKGKGLSPKC